MKRSVIPFTTGVVALSAAVLVTGCCGPKRDRTAAYYNTGSTTQYTASQSESQSARTSAESERTQVRESTTASTTTTAANGQADWSLPLYSESLRVGKREVENGSVRVRKIVRTENASQPVELRREQVVIDREAFDQARRDAEAGRANDLGAAFQEKEITIDLRREEAVVEVTPYMSGRIVAQKKSTTDRQDVARQVRHEEVEVIKNGNDRDIMISERVRTSSHEAVGAPGRSSTKQSGAKRSVQQGDSSRQNTDESEPPRKQQ
jgi:uncharacterized protein (TIGR02271 family)